MNPPFLVVGAAHWDIVARTAAPLPVGADVPGKVSRQPGGVALNVARGLAALSQPVALVAAIGRDPEGDALAAAIAAAGIDPGGLLRHPGATDCYVAIEGADGAPLAAVADCAGLERAGAGLLAALDDGRLPNPWAGSVVFDGNLPPAVLAAAAAHPALSASDLALIPASPAKAAHLAPLITRPRVSLYVNRAEAEALAGRAFADSQAAAAALHALGADTAVVTNGGRPASAATAAGVVTLSPPALAARSLTGAGDSFVARHLAARAQGLAPAPALQAALDAAARHIAQPDEPLLSTLPLA